MKKIIAAALITFLLTVPAFAFLYEVKIYTKQELKKLSNSELVGVYRDAMIERRASETFQGKSGFTPKEYGSYKQLLGLVIDLREEMKLREMDVPPFDEWLR